MEYRIEERAAFRVVGLKMATTNEDQKGMKDIPAFWGETIKRQQQLQVLELMNQEPYGLLGVNVYNTDPDDARKFDFYIACASDKEVPAGMAEYEVPANTWAVFPCNRNEIGKVMMAIVMEWLPSVDYELVDQGYETGYMSGGAPDIEVYGQGDDAEVWVAVKK